MYTLYLLYNVVAMFYCNFFLQALNAQDRIDQSRICFYRHHEVIIILGSKKYLIESRRVPIRRVRRRDAERVPIRPRDYRMGAEALSGLSRLD